MNFIKKRLTTDCLLLIALFLFGLFCSKGLFKYYGFATHDGDHHISRSFDAIQSLKEGHFPLRWAGSLNGWCGVPVFNFFYPLTYYLVFLVNFLVKDVINSLKVVAVWSFTIAPIFFYLWLNKETKNKIASFAGAFLYLFVPYRFLLVYVRFNPEFVAYTFLPIMLWIESSLFERLKKDKTISFKTLFLAFWLSLIGGIFIVSHNFAVVLLLPIIGVYTIIKVFMFRIFAKEKLALLFFVFVSIVGLSSFFWGPMVLERKYVKLNTTWAVNHYRDHFPTLQQVIRSKWDYGTSEPGTEKDGMSFMLGYSQWLVMGATAVYLILTLFQKRKFKLPTEIFFWFSVSCLSLFLILPWSKFVWERIKILQEIQFSWRILGVTSFTIAALSGFLLVAIKDRKVFYFLFFIFTSLSFYGNRNHLRIQPALYPQKYIDYEKNHDHRYATTTMFDDILNKESTMLCLPSKNMPPDMSIAFTPPIKGVVLKTERGNTFGKVSFNSNIGLENNMRLGLEYFPGIYKVKLNGAILETLNCQGKVYLEKVELKKGENILEWKVVQSPTEKIFNYLSIGFLTIWVLFLISYRLVFL